MQRFTLHIHFHQLTLSIPLIYKAGEKVFLRCTESALQSSGTAKVVFYTTYILQQKQKETENIFISNTIKINTVHKYIWREAIYFSSTHFGPAPTSSWQLVHRAVQEMKTECSSSGIWFCVDGQVLNVTTSYSWLLCTSHSTWARECLNRRAL